MADDLKQRTDVRDIITNNPTYQNISGAAEQEKFITACCMVAIEKYLATHPTPRQSWWASPIVEYATVGACILCLCALLWRVL